jgi:hypothetical protein
MPQIFSQPSPNTASIIFVRHRLFSQPSRACPGRNGSRCLVVLRVLTGGSPAPAAVLEAAGAIGFDVDHVFGISGFAGTPFSCAWHDEWDTLSPELD